MAFLSSLVMHDEALKAVVNEPGGSIEIQMLNAADQVVQDARVSLGIPAPLTRGEHPPPGPPWARTFSLRDSVHHLSPEIGLDGLVFIQVVADADHDGHSEEYAPILLERGYRFLEADYLVWGERE